MVVGCGIPTRTAAGIPQLLLAATHLTGFVGNALHECFNPALVLSCGVVVIGYLIASKIAIKAKPKNLEPLFRIPTMIFAIFMMMNVTSGTNDMMIKFGNYRGGEWIIQKALFVKSPFKNVFRRK